MELGSEFNLALSDLSITEDNIFRYLSGYNSYFFDSGRSAIKHIANQLDCGMKVLLPEFICESVSNCFKKEQRVYYKLKDDFSIDVDDLEAKVGTEPAVIFLMHYFGSLQPWVSLERIRSIAEHSGSTIIEDTTHSIFTAKQTIGDYMVCSVRKWMPIPGGGVLYYNENKHALKTPEYPKSNNNLRSYGMILKDLFLVNHFDCNSEYRRIFLESEDMLDVQKNILGISDLSRFIISCVQIGQLKQARRCNFEIVKRELSKLGVKPVIDFREEDIPLLFPLRIQNRDRLRSFLMSKQIYCAVHWPFDGISPEQRPFAKKNAEELLSLPIDQRYGEEHIMYLIDSIRHYGGDLLF